jgi:hypothetical protein
MAETEEHNGELVFNGHLAITGVVCKDGIIQQGADELVKGGGRYAQLFAKEVSACVLQLGEDVGHESGPAWEGISGHFVPLCVHRFHRLEYPAQWRVAAWRAKVVVFV